MKLISTDTETTGLRVWHGDRPFAFSAATPDDDVFFNRFKVDPMTRGLDYRKPTYKAYPYEWWGDMLENPKITKVFHNHKFDRRMFEAAGIKIAGTIHDTMIAMHVLRTMEPTLQLKPLCKKYLGIEDDDEKDLHTSTISGRREGKKKGWKIATEETHGDKPVYADYWLADPKLLEIYARRDATRTITLWLLLEEKLKEEKLWDIYMQEMALAPVTYKMEGRGFRVIPAICRKEIKVHQQKIKDCKAIYEKQCPGININSQYDLRDFIYKKLGVEPSHFTENGNPKVNAEVLSKIENPAVKAILEFKASEKAISNFFQKYLNTMVKDGKEWILHPDFQQVGTVTGRFSCRNPNLQNVADGSYSRSAVPIQARTPFRPREGYLWYHFDYSQIEMWIFAALAKEKKMLDALIAGRDLHKETAEWIWGKEEVARDPNARKRAKLINFGSIYGIGYKKLAIIIGKKEEEALKDLETYRSKFSNVAIFMERISRFASEHGFVEGPMGRRWQVDPDRPYTACNYIVQGSAAWVIKQAMVKVDRFLEEQEVDGGLVCTIHDEHIDEIRIGHDSPSLIRQIVKISEKHGNVFGLDKLPVEVARTTVSWNKKEKIKI